MFKKSTAAVIGFLVILSIFISGCGFKTGNKSPATTESSTVFTTTGETTGPQAQTKADQTTKPTGQTESKQPTVPKTIKPTKEKQVSTAETTKAKKGTETKDIGAKMLFWEVTAKNGKGRLYLLGSVHVGDKDMYPLNEKLMKAFEDSDLLAVECDIIAAESDMSLMLKTLELLKYKDGTKISDHISKDVYTKCKKYLEEKKLYNKVYDNYNPAFWDSLLQGALSEEAGFSLDYGIDRHFLKLAKEKGKEISELESALFQTELVAGFPDEYYELGFTSLLKDQNKTKQEIEKLVEAVLDGNIKVLEEDDPEEEDLTAAERKIVEGVEKKIVDDRNSGMTEKAEGFLKEGKTCFYIVGAAHMVGEKGIVKQLEEKGYKVVRK